MEVGSFLNSLLATDPRPSGALVNLLFDLLIGETFSVNKKIQVRSAVVIPYLLDILATSDDAPLRDQIFEKFFHLLSNSQNVDVLCNVLRLSESLMDMMARAKDQKLFDQLSRLLSLLGSHSFNSKQLKSYYELLERRENSSAENPKRQLSLVQCFQSMTKKQTGPHSYFHFSGNEAGIMVQRVDKWPKNGYAFCSWIRIESLQDPKTGSFSYQPRLFSFSSAEGAGIDVFIERSMTRGNTLHVRSQINNTTAPSTVELANYDFQLQKWHFVSIVHSYKILGRSEVSLYINGQLIQSSLLKYPSLERGISGNIGINPKVDPSGSFFGQMGTIFFFKEPIAQPQIAKILSLKPNVIIGPSEIAEVGANSLFFVYPPRACFGQFCFDANTGPNGEGVPQPSHGLKLSGVQEVISYHVSDSYHCAIGIEGLYPFILAVAPQNKTRGSASLEVDILFRTALHAEWITLLSNFVDHPSIQAEMIMQNSIELLGYIQQKLPPKSITGQTLSSFEHLINSFSANDELKRQAYFNLLFNFQLWIYTDFNTQTHFLLTLASHMQRDPQYFKSLFGVQQWLDVLRSYYWYRCEPDSLCVEEVVDRKTQQVLTRRPSNPTEIKELRSHIILMLHLMLKEEVSEEEVQSIVRFIHDCPDPLQLQDLLQFVLSLLSAADSLSLRHTSRTLKSSNEPPKGLVKALKRAGGASIFYSLLQQEEEALRVLGIQLIDIYNKQASNQMKVNLGQLGLGFDFDENFCFFSNTLMDYNFTEPIYRALLQALFDDYQLSTPIKYNKQKVHSPKLIATIWQLLHNASLDLRHLVLSDFIFVLQQCSPETRDIFLGQLGWQSWLLPLIPLTLDTPLLKDIREAIFTIFQLLFKHSFSKREGWMLLEQTDAFLTMFVRPTDFFCKLEVEIYERILSGVEDFKDLDNRDVVENCAFFVSFFEEILYVPAAATPDAEPGMQRDAKGAWIHWKIVQRLLALSYRLISSKHAESVNAVILKSRGKSFFATVIRLLMVSITEAPTTFACRAIHDKKADFKKVHNQLKQWIEVRQQEARRKQGIGAQEVLERNAQRAFDLYIQDRLHNLDQEIKDLERFMEQTTKMLKAVLFKHIPTPGITTQQSSFTADQLNRIVWVMNHLLYVTHTLQQYKLPVSDSLLLLQRDVITTYRSFVEKHINEVFPENLALLEDANRVAEYLSFIMANQTIMQKLKTIRMTVDLEARQQLLTAQEERRKRVNNVRESVEKITRNEVLKELQLRSTSSDLKKKNCYSEVNRRAAIAMQFAEKQGRLGRLWKSKLRTLSNQRSHLRPKAGAERLYWKLDKTEDALRRRWKLKRNFNGSSHIEASVSFIKAQNAAKKAAAAAAAAAASAALATSPSTGSMISSESTLSPRNDAQGQADDVSKLIGLSSLNQQIRLSSSGLYDLTVEEEADQEGSSSSTSEADKMLPKEDPEWCMVQLADEMKATTFDTRLREEKVICSVVCELVSTFKTIHGKLDVTNQHVYFIADYDLSSGKVDSLSRKWPVSSLEKLMKRRYLLRDKAMEIFFSDQRNFFFDFAEKADRDCALKGIQSAKPPNLTYDGRSPADLLRKSKLTEKWQQRAISNFEYLMHLNSIAGRSYNDLHQYHIFPWVLSDYTSQTIDLSDESIYRDLSKPIGALNPARLKQLKDRCASLEGTDIPKFLYGSHYSNAGSVLYFMLRQEPYTSQFLALQGRFDHADRLFHSIHQTWHNCLQAPQDVKELIPEFFYFPDFLLNSNSLDLGTTQTGIILGDVELPPWANGSIHEFVRINREALESEYVSEHLHEWIDLIFGYKQRGPAAEEADNLFYYLTYEGAVDIDAIDSPVIRKATEEQILNFGQCPTQLLMNPHPKRGKVQIIHKSVWTNPLNFQAYIYTKLSFTPHVVSVRDRLVIIGTDGEFISFNWNQNLASPPSVSNAQPTALTVVDQCLVSPNKSVTTADFGHPFCFGLLSPTVAIYGGFWDNSFRLKQLTAQQPLLQSVREHKGPVTCLAISENNTTIATGSKDATVIVWKVETVVRGLAKYPAINERPVHILRGHTHEISAVAISSGVDIAVSGATDGTVLIHTLRSGRFVRRVENPLMISSSLSPSSSISSSSSSSSNSSSSSSLPTSSSSSSVISSSSSGGSVTSCVVGFLSIATGEGRIVMCSKGNHPHLAVFDLNGNLVKCVQVMDNTGIASLVLSRDGKQVLTGGDQLSVRDLHSLKLIHAYDIVCRVASGQCLYVSQEGRNLFAALQNGDFLVFGYFVN